MGIAAPSSVWRPICGWSRTTHVAALQFKGSAGTGYDALTTAEKETVDRLIASPEDQERRHQVLQMFRDDANKAQPGQADTVLASSEEGAAAADSQEQRGQPRFSDYVHQTLAPLLKDHGSPGTLRKVGPSLRFVSAKLDAQFLFDWIQRPARFRSTTRMPQAFGLWNHLPGSGVEENSSRWRFTAWPPTCGSGVRRMTTLSRRRV